MKFFFSWIFAVISIAGAWGQSGISATLDHACFPSPQADGGQFLLILEVDGSSLSYSKNEKGLWSAACQFALSINDSSRNYVLEKIDVHTPLLSDTNQFYQPFRVLRPLSLPSGSFTAELMPLDKSGKGVEKEKITLPVSVKSGSKAPALSELLFLTQKKIQPDKAIVEQDPALFRLSDFYAPSDSVLSVYAEISGLQHKYSASTQLVTRIRILDAASRSSMDAFGKIKKIPARPFFASRFDLDIKALPSGNYLLAVDVVDSTSRIILKSYKSFQKSNPKADNLPDYTPKVNANFEEELARLSERDCRFMVESLQPIATASEFSTIRYLKKSGTETELRNYLRGFWAKKNEANPALPFLEYQRLMAIGAQKYATKTMPAYQTDRGRVLLQYGEPNLIENEHSDRFRKAMQNLNTIPYEVWYYYTLDTPVKQTDVIFVFVQENRGNDNYRLLHSTGVGEVRNREWRRVVESNATYNFDRLSPDDRYDSKNLQKFR